MSTTIYILGAVLILVIAYAFWVSVRWRKTKKQLDHSQWNAKRIQGKLNQAVWDGKEQEKRIHALEEELRELKAKEITRKQAEGEISVDDRIEELRSQPICIKILSRVNEANIKTMASYPDLELSENLQEQLISTVDNVFTGFSSRIFNLYPRLTKSDIIYCCLYIIGINEKYAAVLTGKTYQTVWTRSNKLRDIFGNKGDMRTIMKEIVRFWK